MNSVLNIDILYLVAEYIEPSPLVYYRLATVSRDFYTVFTSDKVWRHLNPYGLPSNLVQGFWKACDSDPMRATLCSIYWQFTDAPAPLGHNLYSWLGFLCHTDDTEIFKSFEDNETLLKCLFHISGKSIMHASEKIKANKELALIAIRNSSFLLDVLSPSLADDKEVVMASLNGWAPPENVIPYKIPPLQFVSDRLRDDPDVVVLACQQVGKSFVDASARLKGDREVVTKIIAVQGDALLYSDFLEDRDMVLLASKTSYECVLASPKFTSDREIMLAACSIPGTHALCTQTELKEDKEVILAAMRSGGYIPILESQTLRNDKEVALELVSHSQSNRNLGSTDLRDDFEVVMVAVTEAGSNLRYASERLRDNEQIVLAAVSQRGAALEFASSRLRNTEYIVTVAVQRDSFAFACASPELKASNYDLVLKLMEAHGFSLSLVPPNFRFRRELIEAALRKSGDNLQHVPVEDRDDAEIVRIAVAENGMAIRFASSSLLANRGMVTLAVSQDARVLNLISQEFKESHEIMETAIRKDPMAFKYSPQLCGDRRLALLAIAGNYRAYRLVDDSLKRNLEFNIEAVKLSGRVFCLLSEQMRMDPSIQMNANVQWL